MRLRSQWVRYLGVERRIVVGRGLGGGLALVAVVKLAEREWVRVTEKAGK